jgi:transposase
MIMVGCDLPTRKPQVARLNTDTGELGNRELSHDGDAVERFDAARPPPVTVGIERTGDSLWFHALRQRLGHPLLVGEAAKIHAMVGRQTTTDRRDARPLRGLLTDDRFPLVWIPDPTTRDLRALLKHRLRLGRIRTMVKHGLHAIALNQRLALGPSRGSRQGLAQLPALGLLPHNRRRRDDRLELLPWLNRPIDELDLHVATAAAADHHAHRLMTHPGVGPLTALAPVLGLGPVTRSPGRKHVVSAIGLAPAVNASADKSRRGPLSQPGRALLRGVLGQAAPLATRGDAQLKRISFAVLRRRARPKAKVALARRLLIRLYVMRRDHIDYDEFCRRGRARDSGLEPARIPREPKGQPPRPSRRLNGYRSRAGVLGGIDGRA